MKLTPEEIAHAKNLREGIKEIADEEINEALDNYLYVIPGCTVRVTLKIKTTLYGDVIDGELLSVKPVFIVKTPDAKKLCITHDLIGIIEECYRDKAHCLEVLKGLRDQNRNGELLAVVAMGGAIVVKKNAPSEQYA